MKNCNRRYFILVGLGVASLGVYKVYDAIKYKNRENIFYLREFLNIVNKSTEPDLIHFSLNHNSSGKLNSDRDFYNTENIDDVDGWILSKSEIAQAKLIY